MMVATAPSAVPAASPSAAPAAPPVRVVPPTTTGIDAPPVAVSKTWKLYDENGTAGAIVDAIDGAKTVVNAEFFGISDAGKGALLTDAMERAARRGVEVNVIADMASIAAPPFGSFSRFRDRIEDAGGHVIVTSRVPAAISKKVRENPALKHVDHRKIVTIDGSKGFVGGMNFIQATDDYHDSMVQLSGVDAARLSANQLDRWTRSGGTATPAHTKAIEDALAGASLVPTDPNAMRIVDNAPEQGKYELSKAYAEMIRGAKERLWIASPGISDREVMAEVRAAVARGVDVRIVTPGQPPLGIPFINWVARGHLKALSEAGGQSFQIPEVLHRKALIADDEVVLSSYNLTNRSRTHDHEVGVRTKDPEFVGAIAKIMQQDFDRSTKLDPATATSVSDRIGSWLARHMTY